MKILVDAMGGDIAPEVVLEGVAAALAASSVVLGSLGAQHTAFSLTVKLILSLCKCRLRQTAGRLLFNKMGILFAKSRKIISRARFFSTAALGVTEQRPSKGTHNARRQDERKNAEDHFVFHSDAPRV